MKTSIWKLQQWWLGHLTPLPMPTTNFFSSLLLIDTGTNKLDFRTTSCWSLFNGGDRHFNKKNRARFNNNSEGNLAYIKNNLVYNFQGLDILFWFFFIFLDFTSDFLTFKFHVIALHFGTLEIGGEMAPPKFEICVQLQMCSLSPVFISVVLLSPLFRLPCVNFCCRSLSFVSSSDVYTYDCHQ